MQQKVTPFDEDCLSKDLTEMAVFDIDEIVLGRFLGCGGFSDVYEIKAFKQKKKQKKQMNNNRGKNSKTKSKHQAARDFLTKHTKRSKSGEARYAIKFLQEKWIYDREGFQNAAADLLTETEILSDIRHPNILKVRGWATDGADSYLETGRHDGYFIILDRLNETLEERIEKWRRQLKRLNHPFLRDILDKSGQKKKQILIERLTAAFDVAGALTYLHDKNFIYRDLKPSNIGFDVRNDVKLFDFGLARDMPADGAAATDTFEMSGKIGTLRYMAPEVARGSPYNQKADVYSFSHLLWEILSFEKPYEGFSRKLHKERVVKNGFRPKLNDSWSKAIQDLLSRSWDPDMHKRPTMKEVRNILRKEIVVLRGGDSTGLEHNRRRSTFVLELPENIESKEFGAQRRLSTAATKNSVTPRAA